MTCNVLSHPFTIRNYVKTVSDSFFKFHQKCESRCLHSDLQIKLYKNGKNEIGLQNKLKILPQIAPEIRQYIGEIEIMKWYRDKAVHDPQIPILHKNIDDNIEKFKAFLLKLNLK